MLTASQLGMSVEILLNIWDGAHLLELAIGDIFGNDTKIKEVIDTIGKIACFMGYGMFSIFIIFKNQYLFNIIKYKFSFLLFNVINYII